LLIPLISKRKHISLETKLAAALRALGDIPYEDAKKMTPAQVISLYEFDHNMLHRFTQNDEHWNLSPTLIMAHRAKTKQDAKVFAKSRRIRDKLLMKVMIADAHGKWDHEACQKYLKLVERDWKKRKIRSRGFDKTRTRHFDGTVTKRK